MTLKLTGIPEDRRECLSLRIPEGLSQAQLAEKFPQVNAAYVSRIEGFRLHKGVLHSYDKHRRSVKCADMRAFSERTVPEIFGMSATNSNLFHEVIKIIVECPAGTPIKISDWYNKKLENFILTILFL